MCLDLLEMGKLIFVIVSTYIAVCLGEERPIVETHNGLVEGEHRTSYDGNTFSAFEGIPYAKPPVGELRFKEPQPMTPWTGTWIANAKYICAQLNPTTKGFEGHEDCLYINVYVPREKPTGTENFNVIVHIHSGAFMFGSPHQLIGPEYLMDRELIFVTFNYRLGPFGFLSTQDDVLPGNHGLRDQTLALKWIQLNIAKFGGNPKSITLTGMSAGGASVHYHYVSPLSKGLFHRGFSQSGSMLNTWSLQKAPVEKARKLAATTGCNDKSTAVMIKCLRQRSAQQIVEAVREFYDTVLTLAPFGPTIERTPTNAFLPNHPFLLVNTGIVNDVPWIASLTTDEGILPTLLLVDDLEYVDKNWNRLASILLDYHFTVPRARQSELPVKIKQRYFLNRAINNDTVQNLIQVFSDRLFTIDVEKAVRSHAIASKSPVYLLITGYKGQHNMVNILGKEGIEGVCHGDDQFFYLYPNLPNSKLSESTEKMKNLFVDMLVQYANTGKPQLGDVEWKPVSRDKELSHLYIQSPEDIRMKKIDELGAIEFWQWAALRENENVVVFSNGDNRPPAAKKDEL